MKANDKQIGGDHYRSGYQHWDLAVDLGLPYLEGNATKYLSRWRKKHGIQDLEKAKHYVQKIRENFGPHNRVLQTMQMRQLEEFFTANKIDGKDKMAIALVASWVNVEELDRALKVIDDLIATAKRQSGDEGEPISDYPIQREDPEFRTNGDEWRQDGK